MLDRMDAATIAILLEMRIIKDCGGHFEMTPHGMRAVEKELPHFALDSRRTSKLYRQLLAIREKGRKEA